MSGCFVESTDKMIVNDSPFDGIRIAWDNSSMQKLAPMGDRVLRWVGYPRVRRLADGSVMAVYETGSEVEMVRSYDNGKTWEGPVVLFEQLQVEHNDGTSAVIRAANSELYQLQNGVIIVACNYRPSKNEVAPFSIAVKRSTDNGANWSETQILYEAEPRFTDGCWEPAFLQLPDGELQVYFANEAPYTHSDEQEISMVWSDDNGISWSDSIKTVSFRKDRRDGMPAPLLLNDEIIVAIEDNKVGQFKPYIVRTSLSDNWREPVLADSPKREYALTQKMPDDIYAGAPYLMQVPTGEVLLSYQTTSGRTDNWEMSTLEVAIGDTNGRNFNMLSRPFDVPTDREAKWNSLSLWDQNTVVAAATTSFRSRSCEVWIIQGKIIPELEAARIKVKVDGVLDEWNEKMPVFIGSRGKTNLSADISHDGQKFYICAAINDQQLIDEGEELYDSDGLVLFMEPQNPAHDAMEVDAYKIWVNYKGEVKVFRRSENDWKEIKEEGVTAKTLVDDGTGYKLELAVPFSFWKDKVMENFRFTLGLNEKSTDEEGYIEYIIHSNPDSSHTWVPVKLNI